jgi:decaprenyl-phosphate phosphoribosyltransferase
MRPYLQLLRLHQYVKNGFILAPLFFAFRFTDLHLLGNLLMVALGFSFVASAIYILNDYFDREADRQHPTKRNRPLAAGTVTVPGAFGMFGGLLVVGGGMIGLVSVDALLITGLYVLNNLLYSYRFKHVPILDVTQIALGFVLRLYVGQAAGEGLTPLSMWIVLVTFMLALFLGLAKRRDDVLLALDGNKVRKAIDGYNLEFINGAMMLMASVTIVSYISYTISTEVTSRLHTDQLYYTVLFVVVGILRYMQITFVEQKSGSPTKILLRDLFLQLCIVGWLLTFVALVPAARALVFGD